MKMKNANIIEKTFLLCWPAAIIIALIIYLITQSGNYVTSYFLGVASVLLMQSMNYRMLKDLYKNNPSKIKSRTIWLYVARYVFFGVILYISYVDADWNIFYTLGGILTYKFVLVPTTLIFAKKGEDDSDA